jgi:hypothetical protein
MTLLNSDPTWRHSWSIMDFGKFTAGSGDDLLLYDPSGGSGEFYTTHGNTLATAVLSTCEGDYQALRGYFAGLTPNDLPFNIYVQSGSNGASHGGCDDTSLYCDAFSGNDPDLVRMLIVAEADEVFMDNQGKGWDCGSSNGEGLSRVLSTELYPHEQSGFVTGPSWLNSDRPDFVNSTEGTDQNFVSIGCATLFINYLRHQLGFSIYEITQAGGSTLEQTYNNLTGQSGAYPAFNDVLGRRFAPTTSSPLTTDNPFPLRPDLLFYDAGGGTGEFYTTDTQANIALLNSETGWRGSWSIITPGHFALNQTADLLFYDPGAGVGEFYSTDGHGNISLLQSISGWRGSWTKIIPARFAASGLDSLLFYDQGGGTGEFYSVDSTANIQQFNSHTDWRTTWSEIIAASFTGGHFPDLLFYDPTVGEAELYATDGGGNLSLVNSYSGWRTSWSMIIPCNITGSQYPDLLFYDRAAGVGEIYSTDGHANMTLLKSDNTWGTTWTSIHAIGLCELLFFDAGAGIGQFFTTDSRANRTSLQTYTDWRQSWAIIQPGNFS